MDKATAQDRIEIGADIVGSDGKKIGTVVYVVVRPPSMHVTDIVASTGAVLGRDVLIATEKVDQVEGGKVYVALDENQLKDLPDYVEVHYQTPPETWAPEEGFYYPGQSVLWPGTYYPEATSVTVNAPEGTVGLRNGMVVESSEGEKVGTIDAIDEDRTSGDVSAILVKQGHLFSHDTRIPADQIATIHDDRVTLKLTRDEVKVLEEDQHP